MLQQAQGFDFMSDITTTPSFTGLQSISSTPSLSDGSDLQSLSSEWFGSPGFGAADMTAETCLLTSNQLLFPQNPAPFQNINCWPLDMLSMSLAQHPNMSTMASCGVSNPAFDVQQFPENPAAIPACDSNSSTIFSSQQSFGEALKRRNAVFIPRVLSDAALKSFQEEASKAAKRPDRLAGKAKEATHKNDSRCYSDRVNNILKAWFEEIKHNPYPSSQEKKIKLEETGLTPMQLKNWLCNIRRRKLPHSIKRTKKSKRIGSNGKHHYRI
ncbi:hypothetical protein IWW36_003272 [Coemansia brasiliensis]|uniref:Homeobox domain-containing protein n=1 Tax=Coemansia brasiliensis TaxID=2650707 RepID=A0A9W8LZW6_9FUNG|nr:hypothetical protein IWW36_003272 [Coemansia brasiliensis]